METIQVQLYIRREKFSTQQIQQIGHPVPGHYCTIKDVRGTTELISESDWATLELARELCKVNNVSLKVHDTGSLWGLVTSRLRGVSATPTLVVGHQKIVGVPTKEALQRSLEWVSSS